MIAEDCLSKATTETVAKEERNDSTDDEDEEGVSVSEEQLENCRISGFAGA